MNNKSTDKKVFHKRKKFPYNEQANVGNFQNEVVLQERKDLPQDRKILLNKKVWLIAKCVLIGVGIGALIYWGNMPEKTYYPDGTLRSEVDRFLFRKKGQYTQYLPNGYIFKVEYKNGKKEGKGQIVQKSKNGYAARTIYEIPFKDDKLDGILYSDGSVQVSANKGNTFSVETADFQMEGKFLCEPENMLEKIFLKGGPVDAVVSGLECLSVEDIASKDTLAMSISFKGAFNYPNFTKKSTFTIADKRNLFAQNIPYVKNLPYEVIEHFKKMQVKRVQIVIEDNKEITLQSFGDFKKPISQMKFDINDFGEFLRQSKVMADSRDENGFFNILKKIALTGLEINTTGKKPDLLFEGKITPFLFDAEKGSSLKGYNVKGKEIISVKVTKHGFEWEAKYPMSAKKLFTAEVNFDGKMMQKFREQLASAQTLREYQRISRNFSSKKDDFSISGEVEDFTLYNINGDKIFYVDDLKFDIQKEMLKGKIVLLPRQKDEQTLIFNGTNRVVVKSKNAPQKEISFNEAFSFVLLTLSGPVRQGMWMPLMTEGEQYAKEAPASFLGALLLGGRQGYQMAMDKHQTNTVMDYITRCAIVASTSSVLPVGDCSQRALLGSNGGVPYRVRVSPLSRQDYIVIQILDVPREECEKLEDLSTQNITVSGNGCIDARNDMTVMFSM